jgi:hypothetical protein
MSVYPSMRASFLGVLLVAAFRAARAAEAGDCSGGGPDVIKELEAYARGKQKEKPAPDHLCIEQGVMEDRKLTKRFLAACQKIVARDPKDGFCIGWSIEMGAKTLGTLDLFTAVTGLWKIEPFIYGNGVVDSYVVLDDPRSVPLMREAWRAADSDKRATSSNRQHAHNFLVFRHAAVKLMAKHGDATDAAFLTDQATRAKDRGLKRAIARALAAIDKRTAAQRTTAPAPPGP